MKTYLKIPHVFTWFITWHFILIYCLRTTDKYIFIHTLLTYTVIAESLWDPFHEWAHDWNLEKIFFYETYTGHNSSADMCKPVTGWIIICQVKAKRIFRDLDSMSSFVRWVAARTHDATITSLWRQNDVATSFWRHNYVIIASCVRWVLILFDELGNFRVL